MFGHLNEMFGREKVSRDDLVSHSQQRRELSTICSVRKRKI